MLKDDVLKQPKMKFSFLLKNYQNLPNLVLLEE